MKLKTSPVAVIVMAGVLGGGWARAQSQPVITFVGDSASYSGYIAVGELVTLFGTNLSDGGTYQAQAVPLPTQLGTTQVFSSGAPLELLYVSPTQINLLMSTSGPLQNCVGGQCVDLTVHVGSASSAVWFNGYALYAPALFLSGFDCPYLGWPNAAATNVACGLSPTQKPGQFPRPIVTDANYSLVTNQNPARLGQPYVLWLTGLGNPGYTGDLRSQFPTLRIDLSRCCLPASLANPLGNASVLYAGAASGFPGLYQTNFTLPNVSTGPDACGVALQIEVWLSVVANGTGSNFLSVPVYISASENSCVKPGTTITSSPNPSVVGQSVTFNATVTPATATGSVTFSDGTAALGTGALTAGAATFSTSALAAGIHLISATYSGDSNYVGSSSATQVQTVNKTPTTVTLTANPNPSTVGQAVTLTAAVSPPTATGTVTFSEFTCSPAPCSLSFVALGTGAISGGRATFSTSNLSANTHLIAAIYSGDTNYSGGTSTNLTQTINKNSTTVTLSSSPNPSISGQPVTLTASVSPSNATGMVSCGLCSGILSGGQAQCSATPMGPPGVQSLVATYGGDNNYSGSTSAPVLQTVKQNTATTLTSSVNPSTLGQSVSFTALMYFSNATGTITFLDGAATLGSGPVTKAVATFSTSGLSAGSHSITAVYSGDGNFGGSTSAVLTQTLK